MAIHNGAGQRPDVHEMVIIHRFLRREFTLLPALVTSVRAEDTERASLIARHGQALLDALHVHHSGEDELLWPRLPSRAAPNSELVARMKTQHEEVTAAAHALRDLLGRWRASADPATGRQLADAAQALSEALFTHLDEEEASILPLAAEHVSAAEWDQLGKHGVSHTPRNRLLIQLGQILEDTTEAERRAFLAKLPLPPRLLWATVGRRQYSHYVRQVRGSR
jgi:hemerythrin-like domain-containing protein